MMDFALGEVQIRIYFGLTFDSCQITPSIELMEKYFGYYAIDIGTIGNNFLMKEIPFLGTNGYRLEIKIQIAYLVELSIDLYIK
jgi:hypothetical protein